jgi:hypothetical protein
MITVIIILSGERAHRAIMEPGRKMALDPKRAFDGAFAAMRDAPDFDAAVDHFGHALTDFYSLYERAKRPPSSQKLRRDALEATAEGRTALAVAWARKFPTHHLIDTTEAVDAYSGSYTPIYGVLVWRRRPEFTAAEDDEGHRHVFYDNHLAGQPVLDTLQTAVAALLAI